MRPARLAALALLAACGREPGSGFSTGPGVTSAPQLSSSTGEAPGDTSSSSTAAEDSAAASSSSSASSASSSSSGGLSDLGTPPDFGDTPPPGCKGKIDFLFSISSSITMKSSQDSLKASFPGFMATLEQDFADFDYHILSAGPWDIEPGIPSCKGCVDSCPTGPEGYPCAPELEPCDSVMGAGITYPLGWNASNERCELASGRRYIIPGEPDLVDAFTCIATVGTTGVGMTAETTVAALSKKINAFPDGCNAGFLRPDALLVVVAIQDNADEFSDGTPQDWADALLEAKGGDGDAVVLLVVSTDVDDPAGLCGYDPSPEHKLRTWTTLVPHGLFRSICAPSYEPFFAEAAAMVKTQCDVFVPQ